MQPTTSLSWSQTISIFISGAMLEFMLQIFGEFFLQIAIEILVELGFHSLKEPFRHPANPWLAVLGYALLGGILGGISLLFVGHHFIASDSLRLVNLLLSPVTAGLLMVTFGEWRTRRGESLFSIDKFLCGYIFALSLALVRYKFAA